MEALLEIENLTIGFDNADPRVQVIHRVGLGVAHFRGWVNDLVLLAIDYQAALPFMTLAPAVVAFFSNSLILFIAIMGIYGWERYARISRGLTLSAVDQGYAVASRPWALHPGASIRTMCCPTEPTP